MILWVRAQHISWSQVPLFLISDIWCSTLKLQHEHNLIYSVWMVICLEKSLKGHLLYITSFYYNYSSNISNINSDLYFFYFNYVSYLQIHPTISSPALTTLLSLIPVPLNYCSLPYLFLVLWLSLTNLSLPYHTILQTTSPHLSTLHYINHSYFIVTLQFVNCSQLPQSKLLHLHNLVINSNQLSYLWLLLYFNFQPLTLYPKSRTRSKCEGATHKLKPSPSVNQLQPLTHNSINSNITSPSVTCQLDTIGFAFPH